MGKKMDGKKCHERGEAPEGYCHEKLWILEFGGGATFYLFSECRSFVREYG